MLFLIIIALILLFLGWLANRFRTRNLRNALGRDVQRHEVTSINSWMEAADKQEQRKSNEANKDA